MGEWVNGSIGESTAVIHRESFPLEAGSIVNEQPPECESVNGSMGESTAVIHRESSINVVETRTINLLSGAFLNHIDTIVKYNRNFYVGIF